MGLSVLKQSLFCFGPAGEGALSIRHNVEVGTKDDGSIKRRIIIDMLRWWQQSSSNQGEDRAAQGDRRGIHPDALLSQDPLSSPRRRGRFRWRS